MTQEEKQLLLKDLCARLPYGVKVIYDDRAETLLRISSNCYLYTESIVPINIELIKPYLRPMSTMTEEEKAIMDKIWIEDNRLVFADPADIRAYRFYDVAIVDFLNSRHFDYRGLIEKGLALEAPEGMYSI